MSNQKFLEYGDSIENKNFADVKARLNDTNLRLLHGALGIAGESGEIVDLIKKDIMYGKLLNRELLIEELGDALYYFGVVIRAIDSSFDEVMFKNTAKLKKRYPGGYSDKDAIERKDKSKEEGSSKEGAML